KAPAAATLERYAGGVPAHGGAAAAIPGLVDAWEEFHTRWCSRPRAVLLAPAISYARNGIGVSRELALSIAGAAGLFAKYTTMADAVHRDGVPPAFGSVFRQAELASVLEGIALDGRSAFYTGTIADQIAAGVQATGGCMTADDLAAHRAQVLEPLST